MKDPIGERLQDNIDKNKDLAQQAEERRLYDRAIKKDRDNMAYLNRAFPYITEEHLIETIKSLYPELNELFLVNLDERDSNNVPLIKTKNFRTIHISHTRTQYSNGHVDHSNFRTTFRLILAVIENGQVFIKSCKLSNGYWNRRG